jgi:hypothetical protein
MERNKRCLLKLKFEICGYFENTQEQYFFEYKNETATISYYSHRNITPIIQINNYEKFNNTILNLICNWKHNYAPKEFISDGTTWNLNLKFSDGSYVYYTGYEEYPKNFDKLEKYLQELVKNKNKEGNDERL